MDEKKLGVLAAFDKQTEEMLNGCYRALTDNGFSGTQTKGIPYHFTLGGLYPTTDEDRLTALMDSAALDLRRIPFRMNHLGTFGLHVLFAEPNMNYKLLDMCRYFNTSYDMHGCHEWATHATLLIDEPDVIMRAFPIAAGHFRTMDATVERLLLYEFFPVRLIASVVLT